jgi:hypothetical protein
MDHVRHTPNQELYLQVSGAGVEPDTVDAALLLKAASVWFDMSAKAARIKKTNVRFRGLRIIDKCARLATDVTPPLNQNQMDDVIRQVSSGFGRAGFLKKLAADFGEGVTMEVGQGQRSCVVEPPDPAAELFEVTTSGRFTVWRAGGKRPQVLLSWTDAPRAIRHPDFVCDCARDVAAELGRCLYQAIDARITAKVSLETGRVASARLDRYMLVEPAGPFASEVRRWFADTPHTWSNVLSVEDELGRK